MSKIVQRKGKKTEDSSDDTSQGTRGVSTALSDNDESEDSVYESVPSSRQLSVRHSHVNHDSPQRRKRLYESRKVMFILGTILGVVCAIFVGRSSNANFKAELDKIINFNSVSGMLDDWKDSLPSSLNSMLADMSDAANEDPFAGSADAFSVGRRMLLTYNLSCEYNVVMVPGVISTGIESWGTESGGDCPSINHFRKRLWGSFYMLRTMILDKACWLKLIMLDPETGLDPPKIKLRAAQGFDAADFFMAGYWIWNKILQNLAVIGYNPNNMISAAYDWRLAYIDLERRDGYFSKLKLQIEAFKSLTGKKTTLIGHSMGSQVIFYFMKWVEAKGESYGNGGPNWCNEYIGALVDISGTMLGTPKTVPALLSGEMKDTIQLNTLAVYGLERFFSRRERVDMLLTFGGLPSMFPKGGNDIWGNLTNAPDDPSNSLITDTEEVESMIDGPHNDTFGTFMRLNSNDDEEQERFTLDQSIDYLLTISPEWFTNRVKENYSWGIARTKKELEENDGNHQKWSNPLEAALPNAPDMKIYCFYGVGKPTERAYTYRKAEEGSNLNITIDSDSLNPVLLGDGDGTVSIMTHAICHEWQKGSKSRYNPGNSSVTIVEIKHEPDRFDIRGGAKTADHVDILGSAELNELILKVAAGAGDQIANRYISNLNRIVQGLDI